MLIIHLLTCSYISFKVPEKQHSLPRPCFVKGLLITFPALLLPAACSLHSLCPLVSASQHCTEYWIKTCADSQKVHESKWGHFSTIFQPFIISAHLFLVFSYCSLSGNGALDWSSKKKLVRRFFPQGLSPRLSFFSLSKVSDSDSRLCSMPCCMTLRGTTPERGEV